MTLGDLKERYETARAIAQYGCAPTPEHGLAGKMYCPYCLKWWRKWAGSTLNGHSKCVVPSVFKDELKAMFAANPALTYREVSAIIGVSSSVLRSWVAPIRR